MYIVYYEVYKLIISNSKKVLNSFQNIFQLYNIEYFVLSFLDFVYYVIE